MKDHVTALDIIACRRSLDETEAMRIVARMIQETPNPLEEVLDDLVRDSEEPTSGADTKS